MENYFSFIEVFALANVLGFLIGLTLGAIKRAIDFQED